MAQLVTTLGAKAEHELDLILPHEHIFVDLRSLDTPGHGQADETEVVALMATKPRRAGRWAIWEPPTRGWTICQRR